VGNRTYRVLVIVLMTRHACCIGYVVVVIDVAVCTLSGRNYMRTGQWKCRFRVIKRSRLPRGGVMAKLAGLYEPSLHVVGVGRALKILTMAGDARCARQVVIVVHMAIRALPRWNCV
jgi:hypothetical protein